MGIGNWSSTETYYSGDGCMYQNRLYVAQATNTDKIPGQSSVWKLDQVQSPKGITTRFSWRLWRLYEKGDRCTYNGFEWIAQVTHKGMLPGVAVDWKLAAASDLRLSNVGNDDIQQAEDIDDGNHEELETWDPSRLYVEGALCSFGGDIYVTAVQSQGKEPGVADVWG